MNLVTWLFLLASCWPASGGDPCESGVPCEPPVISLDDEPAAVSVAEIRKLFSRHDKAVVAGDEKAALKLYAPDFYAPRWQADRDGAVKRFTDFFKQYEDVQFSTEIERIETSGDYVMVSTCRPFVGRVKQDVARDDFCHAMLLRRSGEREYSIVRLHSVDLDKLPLLDSRNRVYRPSPLCYAVKYPEGFLPVAARTNSAELDSIQFVHPGDHATLQLDVVHPSVPYPPEAALAYDFRDRAWLTKPEAFTGSEWCEGVFGAAAFRADRGDAQDYVVASIYLTPNIGGEILFMVTLTAPPTSYLNYIETLHEFAAAVEPSGRAASPSRPFLECVLEENPRWNTVEDGLYEHPSAPLSLRVPEGIRAFPLAGDRIQRVRFELTSDPGTFAVLRVYDRNKYRIPEDRLLRHMAERVVERYCKGVFEEVGPLTPHAVELLGADGSGLDLETRCPQGSKLVHRIVGCEVDGYYVQLHLIPASPKLTVQDAALERLAAALQWPR